MFSGLLFRAFSFSLLLFEGGNCHPAEKENPVLHGYPLRSTESKIYGGVPAPYRDDSALLEIGGFPRSDPDTLSVGKNHRSPGRKPDPRFLAVQKGAFPKSKEPGLFKQYVSTSTKPRRLSLTKVEPVTGPTTEQNYPQLSRHPTGLEPNVFIPTPVSRTFVKEPEQHFVNRHRHIPVQQEHEGVAYKPNGFQNAGFDLGSRPSASSSYNAQTDQAPDIQWANKAYQTSIARRAQTPSTSSSGESSPYKRNSYGSAIKVKPHSISILFPEHTSSKPPGRSDSVQRRKVPTSPKRIASRPGFRFPPFGDFQDSEEDLSSFDGHADYAPIAQQQNIAAQPGYVSSVPKSAASGYFGPGRKSSSSRSVLFPEPIRNQPLGEWKTPEQQVDASVNKKPEYVISRSRVQHPASTGIDNQNRDVSPSKEDYVDTERQLTVPFRRQTSPQKPLHERQELGNMVKDVSFSSVYDLKNFVKSMRNTFLKPDNFYTFPNNLED
ncbi:hypothetical protein DPEC_G00165430 [Dallia pectoralis]|uniref:Uncharacterized protein n=1 Tax=Dallia pectoralis TaxID=75939 RepID=A0ACC2GHR7_DALPE|nr:hypothetical protein DPEC_G00165430 [Dallia pectoralis]